MNSTGRPFDGSTETPAELRRVGIAACRASPESRHRQRHGAARARSKSIIEGPDPALDRILRSVRESRGVLSGRLRAEYPILERAEIANEVGRVIREEFPWTG
jgi:hypothetical protein